MKQVAPRTHRSVMTRLSVLITLLAGISLAIANADRNDAPTKVWAADAKLSASLQKPVPFDVYTIRLPPGFALSKNDSFKDSRRTEFLGPARVDGTQPAINVWVAQLTPEQAEGDPIAMGSDLLEKSDRSDATDFVREKSEIGMVGVNWVTRFYDTCKVQAGALNVDIRGANYVWIDRGRLVMVSVYDADRYAKQSLPLLEASVYTITPDDDPGEGGLGSVIPPDGE